MDNIGDIFEDEPAVLNGDFTVGDVMTALADSPTVAVYKDSSDTEHTTTYVPAVVDGMTGAYRVVIDTSASAFFAAGSDYTVRFKSGTLGGVSLVGRIFGRFSINNRPVRLGAVAHGGTGCTITFSNSDASNPAVLVRNTLGPGVTIWCAGHGLGFMSDSNAINISDSGGNGIAMAQSIGSGILVGSTSLDSLISQIDTNVDSVLEDTGTTIPGTITTVDTVVDAIKATTDKLDTALELDGAVYRYTTNALEQSPAGTVPTAAEIRAEIDSNSTQLAAIVADTNELQTDWANGGRLDLILDARASQTSVDTIDGIVDNILLDTAEIGAAGAGLTAVPWNAAWDAEVQSEVADALGVYDPPTNAEMEARTLAAASYATATNLATVDTVVDAIKAVTDLLPDAGALTSLATAAALATVDANVDAVLEDTGTTLPATLATIAGYIDTEIATIDTVVDAIKLTTDKLDDTLEDDAGTYRFTENALEQAPSGGSGTADWTDDEKTAIRAILGIPASGTTPADPSTGILDTIRDAVGVVDGVVDAILVDTGTTLDGKLDTIDSNVDAILEDTGTTLPATLADLPTTAEFEARTLVAADYFVVSDYTAPPSAATISTQVAADLATAHGAGSWATATGFAVAGDAMALTSSERNSVADAILSRDVSNVEDTAGDHSLCYVVLAASEWSVSSTTLTVKKTDGSTTFATKTLTKTAGDDPVRGVD